MVSSSGLILYLVFVALFFYVLYVVVHKAVLNALRVHAREQRGSASPGSAGSPG
jgi:hypothetical protein